MQTGVEPHLPVTIYFNRVIDRSLLDIQVYETFTGVTYDLDAMQGKSSIENQQVDFIEVDRNHERVPGGVSFYPQDTLVSFYPLREFAYGATVYVDVIYNAQILAKQSYKIRPLPTFIRGNMINDNNQPLQDITVSIPSLGRQTTTNRLGNYGFGYGDTAEKALPAGRYKMLFNPGLKNIHYGSLERWVIVRSGKITDAPQARLALLDETTPFQRINSREMASLANGDLQLDLTAADVYFADGRRQGDIALKFTENGNLNYSSLPNAMPHWMYVVQPMGIEVNGKVGFDFTMPQLFGSFDYVPADGSYMVILGYNSGAQSLMPIGVGRVQNNHLISEQPIEMDNLSYLGYALVLPEYQALLQQYVDGSISLDALITGLSQQ